jgi:membrane protein DedA with SNARE-associated domain
VAAAERIFASRGAWAVFFGRFVAVLRILAGPLAGSLRMPYGRFLVANACGIAWAAGMTYLIWFLGVAAGQWLSWLSWFGLVAAVAGVTISLLIRKTAGSPSKRSRNSSRTRGGRLSARGILPAREAVSRGDGNGRSRSRAAAML